MQFIAGILALFIIIKLWFSSRVELSLKIFLSVLLLITLPLRILFPLFSNIIYLLALILIVIVLIWKGEKIR
ncbi:MAG TPA: hypothetical protein PKJ08_03965 [Candidatus Cloacimonadota bacterium]|nr:hypothetical protein [Candidatus Cloacimonadota bacterium]